VSVEGQIVVPSVTVDENLQGTALVFPGMGPVRFADVSRFMILNPVVQKYVAIADDVLGYSIVDRFRDDPQDYSEAAQVSFLVNSLALAEWARETLDVRPEICTGLSFGEKAMAAHTGSLSVEDAVWMTAHLARCMDEYFEQEHQDVVTHSFARVSRERLAAILSELDARDEWQEISCYVDENLHMVSLRERNLEWFTGQVRAAGGMSLYTMRPPMHSAILLGLRRKAEQEVLGRLRFADPELPVLADQDGRTVTTGAGILTILLDSFDRPMSWPDVIAQLRRQGIGRLCIAGSDNLFGRVRCARQNFGILAVDPRMAMQPRRTSVLA
jgi:[acyl-carrier-protein] S-malonyltransferase